DNLVFSRVVSHIGRVVPPAEALHGWRYASGAFTETPMLVAGIRYAGQRDGRLDRLGSATSNPVRMDGPGP
ncbi:unnamed protein product, partial [Musa acuminata subsp. burmannicoides]